MMILRFTFLLALLAFAGGSRADSFSISLEVSNGKGKQTVSAPSERSAPREIDARRKFESAADARFTAKWKVTRVGKEPVKDVLVHFYVVRIEKPGQAPPPLEPKNVVIESAQTMDFAADGTTSGELQFRTDGPGVYLARLETQVSETDKSSPITFSAMDLVVK